MNMREAIEASTILCKKKDVELPLSGDFSLLRVWPMKPVEMFQDSTFFKVYDLHWLYVSVLLSQANKLDLNLQQYFQVHAPNGKLKPGVMRKGISLIELGAKIGGLDLAFRACALGDYMDQWKVRTPEDLGASGELASALASQFLRVERESVRG